MYALWFSDGEHETFGCLTCKRGFVSKRAIERHFDRNPSHGEVTITGSEIAEGRPGPDSDDVPRGVARRRLLRRLSRDPEAPPPDTGGDPAADRTQHTDSPVNANADEDEDGIEGNGERPR